MFWMASAIFTHRIPFSLNNSKCENSVKWATWSRRRRREHVVDQTEKAGVSWDLFFGAYHFCSIKTVDLATNWCCRHHRRPRRECCQPFFLPKNIFFLVATISREKNLWRRRRRDHVAHFTEFSHFELFRLWEITRPQTLSRNHAEDI